MEKKHYCMITTFFMDGSNARRLEQVEEMRLPYRIPHSTHGDDAEEGVYYYDIEQVKDILLIEFLNEQFEPMDMYVRRCTVTPDTFWYEVYHMKLNEVVCKAHTLDQIMDYYTYYWEEGRFELNRRIKAMEVQDAS